MRKLVFLLVMLLVLPFASVSALDSTTGITAMAQYAPANANVFFAMRIGDDFVDEIQAVIDRAQRKVPVDFNLPPANLRESLVQSFASSPVSYEEVQAALGDTIAFSSVDGGGLVPRRADLQESADSFVAVQVADRLKLEDLLSRAPDLTMTGTEGDFTMYEATPGGIIAVGDSIMYVANDSAAVESVQGGESLAGNETFVQTMDSLPAETYNIAAYVNMAGLMESMPDAAGLEVMGMSAETFGTIGIGLTILDERVLVIDTTQTAQIMPMMSGISYEPVNPDFLRNVPAGSDLLIHATNLGGYVQTMMTLLDMTASTGGGGGGAKPSVQIGGMFGMTGLDLQEDIIGGATGDFALFNGIDLQGIIGVISGGEFDTLPLNAGIAIGMKDAAAASNIATKLGTFIKTMGANAEGVTIGSATINGVEVTNISMTPDPRMGLTVEVMIGAKDDVFFVATSDVAQHITGGGDDLSGDATYTGAANYILPGSSQVFYGTDEGLIVGSVIPLALIAPTIDNIFNNMVEDLRQSSSVPGNTRQTIQFDPNDQMRQMMLALETVTSIIDSASISTARQGDVTLTRVVLSLE